MIDILNYIAVCIYGCVLSATFCDMGKTARSRWTIVGITAAMLAIQGGVLIVFEVEVLRAWYPLITHLPLILSLWICHKRLIWSFGSVMTAYLCCQLRRWFGLLIVAVAGGGDRTLDVVELVLTLPLLALLVRFVAPPVSRFGEQATSAQYSFLLIPTIYYLFDYVAIVYTDWLYSGVAAVVEFMPFVCCAAYLWYVLYISEKEKEHLLLTADRNNLNLQITQSVRELSALRESQQQAAAYRHDLHHHLQYLSACIENGELPKAQAYIHDINEEIAAQKVVPYCENEAVNLMLSSYAARAAQAGVEMDIQVTFAPILGVATSDLCVVLGNGLENALHACTGLPAGKMKKRIQVRGHEKGGKILIQIINPCAGEVHFENSLPTATQQGHGIGVRSIQAIAKRYGGLCSFQVDNGNFILRIFL